MELQKFIRGRFSQEPNLAGDLSKAGNCTGLEKVPAWNKLVAGNSPCLELARSKMVSPRAWKMLSPGLHSRLEKLAGWKKALAGNDSWLEQGLCESQKKLDHNMYIFQK